jgi:hypothetical protein
MEKFEAPQGNLKENQQEKIHGSERVEKSSFEVPKVI